MSYTTQNFDGTVITKHGVYMADGRSYNQFVGKVSILEGKETT